MSLWNYRNMPLETCTFSSVAMSSTGSIISGHVDSLAHTDWPGLQPFLMSTLAFSHLSVHVCAWNPHWWCYQKCLLFALLQQDKIIIPLEPANASSFSLFGQAWTFWHHQCCFKISGGTQSCSKFQFSESFLAQLCYNKSHAKGNICADKLKSAVALM